MKRSILILCTALILLFAQSDSYSQFFSLQGDGVSVEPYGSLFVMSEKEVGKEIAFSLQLQRIQEGLEVVDVTSDNPYLALRYKYDSHTLFATYTIHAYPRDEATLFFLCKQNDTFMKIPVHIDFLVRQTLHPIANLTLQDYPMAFAVKKKVAYVGTFGDGIYVLDISNPTSPKILHHISAGEGSVLKGAVTDLHVDGDRLYVALGGEGVALFDITDANNPVLIATKESGREYWAIYGQSLEDKSYAIGKEYIYALDKKQGVLDIFDSSLTLVQQIEIVPSERDMRVYVESVYLPPYGIIGRYIFITGEEIGLQIYYCKGNGFTGITKIYDNPELHLSGIKSYHHSISLSVNGKEHTFYGIYTDVYPFLLFGAKTYQLRVQARYVDGELQKNIDLREITKNGESINSSGFVSDRYDDLTAGNYHFITFKYNGTRFEVQRRLITSCFGQGAMDEQYFLCANKNEKDFEIFNPFLHRLYLAQGWNSVALPIDKEISPDNFTHAKIVWRWNSATQSWQAYSSDSALQRQIKKMKMLCTKLVAGEGFWVYNDRNETKIFKGETSYKLVPLQSGWNFLGSGEPIESYYNIDTHIRYIWSYFNGSWKFYGGDEYFEQNTLHFIDACQAFWAYAL